MNAGIHLTAADFNPSQEEVLADPRVIRVIQEVTAEFRDKAINKRVQGLVDEMNHLESLRSSPTRGEVEAAAAWKDMTGESLKVKPQYVHAGDTLRVPYWQRKLEKDALKASSVPPEAPGPFVTPSEVADPPVAFWDGLCVPGQSMDELNAEIAENSDEMAVDELLSEQDYRDNTPSMPIEPIRLRAPATPVPPPSGELVKQAIADKLSLSLLLTDEIQERFGEGSSDVSETVYATNPTDIRDCFDEAQLITACAGAENLYGSVSVIQHDKVGSGRRVLWQSRFVEKKSN